MLIAGSTAAAVILAAVLLWIADAQKPGVAVKSAGTAPAGLSQGAVWALSLVRARPGQRDRLERFLQANWLALDEQALRQHRISAYRLLRADADPKESSWDYAVIIEYADREAMTAFVPFYLGLARSSPHVRIDGLDFADLGEVVEQKIVEPVKADAQQP